MIFQCDFCGKKFRSEKRYTSHQCPEFKKNSIFKSLEGKAAFIYYNEWKKSMKMPTSSIETFIHSRYYSAFLKFSKFATLKMLPDKLDYINFMVKKIIPPTFWYDEDFYNLYIEYFDKKSLDYKLKISLTTLEEISLMLECSVGDFYKNIKPMEIVKLIINRRLSPWLLVPSKKFHNFIIFNCNQEEKILISTVLNLPKWREIISNNYPDYTLCKKIIEEYSI